MLIWIIFTLCCISATGIVVESYLFRGIRSRIDAWAKRGRLSGLWNYSRRSKMAKLVHCSMCAGFHVGWLLYLLFLIGGVTLPFLPVPLGIIAAALLSSRSSYWAIQSFGDGGFHVTIKKSS